MQSVTVSQGFCKSFKKVVRCHLPSKQDKRAEIAFSEVNFTKVEDSGNLLDRDQRMVHLQLSGLSNLRSKAVLDCGCGAGKDAAIVAGLGNFVVGTDISYKAIKSAKETANNYDVDVSFVVADSENLPFRYSAFDACYCFWTLHHFPRIDGILSQLRSSLKSDGRIVIIEPNGSNIVVRTSELIENLIRPWLTRTGVDTPNERIHQFEIYTKDLERTGFKDIHSVQWFGGGVPPLPNRALFTVLVYVRRLLLLATWHLLPPPMNGSDFVLTARKA